MRVRLVQREIRDLEIRRHLDDAVKAGVGLICFGELAGTGCLYTAREVPTADHWIKLAREYPIEVMMGAAIQTEAGLRNAYLYIKPDGSKAYYKINLFPGMGEDKVYVAGSELSVWDSPFGKTGVTICYDLRFGDMYSKLVKAGATTILVPAAFPRIRIADWNSLLIQRAKENHVTMIGINTVGDDGTNRFGGHTTMVDPYGKVVFKADGNRSAAIDVDISNMGEGKIPIDINTFE